MAKTLIVCSTKAGETVKIGELIAEGIRMAGHEAVVKNGTEIKKEEDLDGYDALVLGSGTYHGGMLEGMKRILFLAEKVDLKGKIGGAFGAYGWSGEAPGRIFDTMKNIFQMQMVANPLMLKSSKLGGGITMAQEYGKEVAQQL